MAELLDTTADKINTKMIPALEDLGLKLRTVLLMTSGNALG